MISGLVDTFLPTLRTTSVLNGVASKSRSNIHFMDMGSTLIRYRINGDCDPTIVLNTDPPSTIESYDQTIAELSRYFRVITFEIPGFGFSFPKKFNFRFDFESITTVLSQFLIALDLGPYVLSFPCVLGYSAIKIANVYPDLISHLVLNQVPCWQEILNWKKRRDSKGILSTPVLGQMALQMLKQKRLDSWFELAIAEPKKARKLTEETLWAFKYGACFSLASSFQFYITEQEPDVQQVKQPSLIIWGECDGSHRHTDKSQTGHLTLDYEELYLPNIGHSPEIENPEIFAEAIKRLVS